MNSPDSAFWRDRPVFVTGGTGLVGGWLVKELIDSCSKVTLLLRSGSESKLLAHECSPGRINVVNGDLNDFAVLRTTLRAQRIKTVFHLGAQTQAETAKSDPAGTLEANVRGTWQLLEAARQVGVEQVLVASSAKAYKPVFPYDVSKLCADFISRMYAHNYGLQVAVARCPNIFGGGDLNFRRLIPDLIRCTLQHQRFVIRSNGESVHDFLYVRDAVHAYLLLAEEVAVNPEPTGEIFEFYPGAPMTVLGIVQRTLRLMGRPDLEPSIQTGTREETDERSPILETIRRVPGWTPQYSLDRGLAETIAWYRAYLTVVKEEAEDRQTVAAVAASGGE